VEWAFQQYKRMREAGHAPQREACTAVIQALCTAGQVREASLVSCATPNSEDFAP
jgi:hypothetical protein